MIIGNGMIARAFSEFSPDNRVLIFASGVSDSLEVGPDAFEREKTLLQRARREHPQKLLVYFGTCSSIDPDRLGTPYVRHKLEMETLLSDAGGPWMSLRLPLAIGPRHRSKTLAQFLYEEISNDRAFEVWANATRYPIDVDDTVRIARLFFEEKSLWNSRINVALRAFRVLDFVQSMEGIVGRRARYELVPKGQHYDLPCPEVKALSDVLGLDLSEHYLERTLRKYFGSSIQDGVPPTRRPL